jgi:multicomponent Na+:H+ antiporter subunit E
VVAVPVHGCPTSLLAAIANLIALTPGTMTVRIETDPPTLYVHVLIFRDIESVRVKIERLNRHVVLSFAAKDDCARFLEATR